MQTKKVRIFCNWLKLTEKKGCRQQKYERNTQFDVIEINLNEIDIEFSDDLLRAAHFFAD